MALFISPMAFLFAAHAATPPVRIVLPENPTDYFPILEKADSKCVRSGYVTLQPSTNVGSHGTEDFEELVIGLEGNGEMVTKGAGRVAIGKGVVVHAFPHTEHDVRNTGTSVLRYIYFAADTRCGGKPLKTSDH